jgi:hypothetical protein
MHYCIKQVTAGIVSQPAAAACLKLKSLKETALPKAFAAVVARLLPFGGGFYCLQEP